MITIDLRGQTICVSGGSGSIGHAVAVEVARAGANVVVMDLHPSAVDSAVASLPLDGGEALGLTVDIRDGDDVEKALSRVAERFGGVNGLVNAAGILRTGAIDEMDPAEWQNIFDVNVTGTYLATKAATPYLKQAGSGSIVNVSSVSAFIGSGDGFAYTATKGAVLSFTYGVAGDLAPSNIRVNAVCPGWVSGGFTQQAMDQSDDPQALVDLAASLHYLGRMASPTDVANAVVWLLSPLSSFVTGTAMFVDGGYMVKRGI